MRNQLSDSMIKGRIAEAIVEEMFLAMGYEVYRYDTKRNGFIHNFNKNSHKLILFSNC